MRLVVLKLGVPYNNLELGAFGEKENNRKCVPGEANGGAVGGRKYCVCGLVGIVILVWQVAIQKKRTRSGKSWNTFCGKGEKSIESG